MSERCDALALFGATGDLAYKKIFPSLHAMVRHGRLDVPVVALGREPWDVDQIRARARASIDEHGGGVDEETFERLAGLLRYVGGDYNDAKTFEGLHAALGAAQRPCHYLAIPPSAFATMELHFDSWRWADVPFYIRAGKCLPGTATEVLVSLRHPPQKVFSGVELAAGPPNHFRFRLGPEVEIALGARVNKPGVPGASESIELFVTKDRRELQEPYDRLLDDAMDGDPILFAREDEVETAWKIVDPILEKPSPLHQYEPGSWGPVQADGLLAARGGWHEPRIGEGRS